MLLVPVAVSDDVAEEVEDEEDDDELLPNKLLSKFESQLPELRLEDEDAEDVAAAVEDVVVAAVELRDEDSDPSKSSKRELQKLPELEVVAVRAVEVAAAAVRAVVETAATVVWVVEVSESPKSLAKRPSAVVDVAVDVAAVVATTVTVTISLLASFGSLTGAATAIAATTRSFKFMIQGKRNHEEGIEKGKAHGQNSEIERIQRQTLLRYRNKKGKRQKERQ